MFPQRIHRHKPIQPPSPVSKPGESSHHKRNVFQRLGGKLPVIEAAATLSKEDDSSFSQRSVEPKAKKLRRVVAAVSEDIEPLELRAFRTIPSPAIAFSNVPSPERLETGDNTIPAIISPVTMYASAETSTNARQQSKSGKRPFKAEVESSGTSSDDNFANFSKRSRESGSVSSKKDQDRHSDDNSQSKKARSYISKPSSKSFHKVDSGLLSQSSKERGYHRHRNHDSSASLERRTSESKIYEDNSDEFKAKDAFLRSHVSDRSPGYVGRHRDAELPSLLDVSLPSEVARSRELRRSSTRGSDGRSYEVLTTEGKQRSRRGGVKEFRERADIRHHVNPRYQVEKERSPEDSFQRRRPPDYNMSPSLERHQRPAPTVTAQFASWKQRPELKRRNNRQRQPRRTFAPSQRGKSDQQSNVGYDGGKLSGATMKLSNRSRRLMSNRRFRQSPASFGGHVGDFASDGFSHEDAGAVSRFRKPRKHLRGEDVAVELQRTHKHKLPLRGKKDDERLQYDGERCSPFRDIREGSKQRVAPTDGLKSADNYSSSQKRSSPSCDRVCVPAKSLRDDRRLKHRRRERASSTRDHKELVTKSRSREVSIANSEAKRSESKRRRSAKEQDDKAKAKAPDSCNFSEDECLPTSVGLLSQSVADLSVEAASAADDISPLGVCKALQINWDSLFVGKSDDAAASVPENSNDRRHRYAASSVLAKLGVSTGILNVSDEVEQFKWLAKAADGTSEMACLGALRAAKFRSAQFQRDTFRTFGLGCHKALSARIDLELRRNLCELVARVKDQQVSSDVTIPYNDILHKRSREIFFKKCEFATN